MSVDKKDKMSVDNTRVDKVLVDKMSHGQLSFCHSVLFLLAVHTTKLSS
jgi:hypothetical protein